MLGEIALYQEFDLAVGQAVDDPILLRSLTSHQGQLEVTMVSKKPTEKIKIRDSYLGPAPQKPPASQEKPKDPSENGSKTKK